MAKTIVTADQGGTGQSAYTVGDIVYADTTASLAKTSCLNGRVCTDGDRSGVCSRMGSGYWLLHV